METHLLWLLMTAYIPYQLVTPLDKLKAFLLATSPHALVYF